MLKNEKVTNVVLVLAVIVVLAFFAFAVRIRPAADNVALLRRTDVTHTFGAEGVVKRLQSQKGVTSVEADLSGEFVAAAYDSKAVKPESIAAEASAVGHPYELAKVVTVAQYKAMTGKMPGGDTKVACSSGCGQ